MWKPPNFFVCEISLSTVLCGRIYKSISGGLTRKCKGKAAPFAFRAFALYSSAVPLYNRFDDGKTETASGRGVRSACGGNGIGSSEDVVHSVLRDAVAGIGY